MAAESDHGAGDRLARIDIRYLAAELALLAAPVGGA